MTGKLISAAFVIALAAPVAAQETGEPGARDGTTIVVSCFRGPMKVVVWDRPTTRFVDSLVDVGYSYGDALAIGERICRDETLVGNPGALSAEMRRIYDETR